MSTTPTCYLPALPSQSVHYTHNQSFNSLQDLLLAFVDCVERNGAKLAIPRTVLELDPATMPPEALIPRMAGMGLLPGPGGSGLGPYGGRGGPGNIPITVQVG